MHVSPFMIWLEDVFRTFVFHIRSNGLLTALCSTIFDKLVVSHIAKKCYPFEEPERSSLVLNLPGKDYDADQFSTVYMQIFYLKSSEIQGKYYVHHYFYPPSSFLLSFFFTYTFLIAPSLPSKLCPVLHWSTEFSFFIFQMIYFGTHSCHLCK
jgi:hypothetical protein